MALVQAKDFTITIGNAISSPDGENNFKTALDNVGNNEFQFAPVSKEIEFKEPEVTTEEVKLLGATGGIQNQELDPQQATKGEFTGTLIVSPEDTNEFDFEQFKLTASTTTATDYAKRYNYASASPSAGVAVVIQAAPGSGIPTINWLLNNATIETIGGVKIDADGHATQEIKISASAADCWKEWDLDP